MFKRGQVVRCIRPYGATHHNTLSDNALYTVQEYIPPCRTDIRFTFPAYVQILDDEGNPVTCHASRFISLERQTNA